MTVTDLLERARRHGLEMEPAGDRLKLRAPERPPDDLLDDLRQHKPQLLEALQAERAREAAVDETWARLQTVYLWAGQPSGWLTDEVREAEASAEALWIASRREPQLDTEFRDALAHWEALAACAIRQAAENTK